jgi:hypothetical protein
MIITFYPYKDSTIYEEFPYKSTELDSILELSHTYSSQKKYNSRILIQFSNDEIQESLAKYSILSASYFLKLNSANIDELPIDTALNIYAVSESWVSGKGFFDAKPEITNGAGWQFRTAKDINQWGVNTVNSEYLHVSGGGTWISESLIVKQLNEKDNDLFIDVSSIFNNFDSNVYPNNGLILKYTASLENSEYPYTKLQYFSRNSNTIYSPKLFLIWDDSTFSTGSLSEVNLNNEFVLYSKLNQEYNQNDTVKIQVQSRPKYIQKVYSTESLYRENYFIPSSSYYEIRDSVTNDIIIPFNTTGTKISCDASGNYFVFNMSNLQPERYYKFIYKIIKNNLELIVDSDQYFKVVR